MRLFVGVVPPQQVVDHLDAFLEVRREAAEFRWSLAEQWHVTLAFAGEAPERALDEAVERLARAASRRTPFGLAIAGGGAFPAPARARVLFAGLVGVTEPGRAAELEHTAEPEHASDDARPGAVPPLEELERLATGARAALSKAGAPVDGQRFRPHLTLGRLGRPAEVSNWVRLLDAYRGPAWTVDEITLVESHLGEGPRGTPRHEILETFPLGR